MNRVKIRVTQDIIDRAVPKSGTHCVLATAIKEQANLPKGWTAHSTHDGRGEGYLCWFVIHYENMSIASSHPVQVLPLPVRAVKIADRFDAGETIKPFSFTLKI